MKRIITSVLAMISVFSLLLGCTNENTAVTTEGTTAVQTSTATTPETTVVPQPAADPNAPYTPTEEEQEYIEQYYNELCDRYNSDEYKAKYPLRSDIMWCDGETYDFYDNGDFSDYAILPIRFLWWNMDIDYIPQTLMVRLGIPGDHYIYKKGFQPYIQKTRDKYTTSWSYACDVAYHEFLSGRKFAVKIKLCSDEYYNADDKTEIVRAEEDYFESLGYEVIRNYENKGNFIIAALTMEQFDNIISDSNYISSLTYKFQARTPSGCYEFQPVNYYELGMYEE